MPVITNLCCTLVRIVAIGGLRAAPTRQYGRGRIVANEAYTGFCGAVVAIVAIIDICATARPGHVVVGTRLIESAGI